MSEAHQILSTWWQSTSEVPLASEAGEATATAIERRYGVMLPRDFRDYLTRVAPAEDFWDDGDGIWWAPGRIRNIPEEYEHPLSDQTVAKNAASYLFFADFMIWCWAWAICCDDSADRGKVAVINGAGDRIVADSFTDFVEAYVANSRSVS